MAATYFAHHLPRLAALLDALELLLGRPVTMRFVAVHDLAPSVSSLHSSTRWKAQGVTLYNPILSHFDLSNTSLTLI